MSRHHNLTQLFIPWRRQIYRRFCWLLFTAVLGLVVACNEAAPPTYNSSVAGADVTCGSSLGGPKDNPLKQLYGPAAFSWTDEIRWQCVYNIKDYALPSDTARYLAALDDAMENGGGVIYLPADVYYFEDDLPLGEGIVLRGDPPEQSNAKAEDFRPPTRLVFPEYEPSRSGEGTPNDTAFKRIVTPNPDTDSNQGLVFLDIERAAIDLTGDPDKGTMKNRFVFGVRNNNVAAPAPNVPDPTFQPGWLRFSDPQVANIRITTSENALVANSRLNDQVTDTYDQSDYVVKTQDGSGFVTYSEGDKAPFSYSDHLGIVVNRSKPDGFAYATTPEAEPGLFRSGVTVQDNWVLKTSQSGIQAAGEGLTIRRNVVSDQSGKVAWVDSTGLRQPTDSTRYDNRAIDWAGHNVTIEGNNFVVYRHKIMDTPDFSNDGEGIFIGACCGGTSVDGLAVRKNVGQGSIGIYGVPNVQRVMIEDNEITASNADQPAVYINADSNGEPHSMSKVVVKNNRLRGDILTQAGLGGSDVAVQNNRGTGAITYSCGVEVQGNSGFTTNPCLSTRQANAS